MATYKEIKGDTIEVVTSDPTNPGEGDIWYNSTTGVIKGYQYSESWSSGANLGTGRRGNSGGGTLTAGITFAGRISGGETGATEEYNGTSWSEQNDMGTARAFIAGAGTQTAGLGFGGYTPGSTYRAEVEEYNGTSWSEQNNLPSGQLQCSGCGTQTAGFNFGPYGPGVTLGASPTNLYDGTNWTSGPVQNTARAIISGNGDSSDALIFGGAPGSGESAATESWNGTAFSNVNSLNNARYELGDGASFGTKSSGLAVGGYEPTNSRNFVESWDGTSWSNTTALTTGRKEFAAVGTRTSGFAAGGQSPSVNELTSTEEWSAGNVTKNFTTS